YATNPHARDFGLNEGVDLRGCKEPDHAGLEMVARRDGVMNIGHIQRLYDNLEVLLDRCVGAYKTVNRNG
ncbi:MAG: hypothetical protein Q8O44_00175, partial [Syntrophales bacterium]|nr:hypothetical protein [Syntrophales bacterium]